VEEEKRADMTNTNKPKDWIDEIQDIFAWVIMAAFVIFMLPVFAAVALIWLVGLGPSVSYENSPPPDRD